MLHNATPHQNMIGFVSRQKVPQFDCSTPVFSVSQTANVGQNPIITAHKPAKKCDLYVLPANPVATVTRNNNMAITNVLPLHLR